MAAAVRPGRWIAGALIPRLMSPCDQVRRAVLNIAKSCFSAMHTHDLTVMLRHLSDFELKRRAWGSAAGLFVSSRKLILPQARLLGPMSRGRLESGVLRCDRTGAYCQRQRLASALLVAMFLTARKSHSDPDYTVRDGSTALSIGIFLL